MNHAYHRLILELAYITCSFRVKAREQPEEERIAELDKEHRNGTCLDPINRNLLRIFSPFAFVATALRQQRLKRLEAMNKVSQSGYRLGRRICVRVKFRKFRMG